MRSVLVMLAMIAALLAGGWFGGETLLARAARQAIAADPRLSAARVSELREAGRIGVRIETPQFDDPTRDMAASGAWLDLWVPPTAPNEVHLSAAPGTTLDAAGRSFALGPAGAEGEMRFSPTHSLALSSAALRSEGTTLDGAPLVGVIEVTAELVGYGADSPIGTGAAYDIAGNISDVRLDALTGGQLPGPASAQGTGRVWLSGVPLTAGALTEGRVPDSQPHLVGLRADGVDLALGDLRARLYTRLTADEAGLAVGEIVIDTADTEGFVARAADLGLFPASMVPLAGAALKSLAERPPAPPPADGAVPDPAAAPTSVTAAVSASRSGQGLDSSHHLLPKPGWPAARTGETRILLALRGGKVWLGPLPLGPAPRLTPPPA